ncbi:MAG TPA: DUF4126 domain-containing protein [Bryobacteraceae bacterium]|nr:DUF4126 domain-containing protein [Bryobacteraceae bacterium]
MDTVHLLGSAMGLGLMAGIRLYATVFALGLAIRMGWFDLSPSFANLSVLAQTPVLAVSGVAFAVEFLADKVPWIDSMWDSVHTVIRPVGAAVLGFTALGSLDPTTQTLIALLCGGVAFTGHTSKAATRLVVNHSPEPFTNMGLSLAEELMVPAGLWIAFEHPLLAISIVGVFLAIFAWLSPEVIRLLHVSWMALRCLIARWFGSPVPVADVPLPESPVARLLRTLPFQPLPPKYARRLEGNASAGIQCVGTHRVRGLKNSIGYLCVTPDGLVFVAQRMFRLRTYRVPWSNLQNVSLKRGIFFDSLSLVLIDGEVGFDLFKMRTAADPQSYEAPHTVKA